MPSFKELLQNDPLFQSIKDVTEGKSKTNEAEVKGAMGKIEKEDSKKKKKDDDKIAPDTEKQDDGEGLDKVDPKQAKGDFKDREDKDIDNDGDSDDSDEYLHKKRKAIGKAMAKEDVDKADETPNGDEDDAEDEAPKKKKKKDVKKQDAPKDDAEVSKDAETVDTEPTLDEDKMTPEQEKKKEEIVMKLKKKKADFVKRYGDRADDVMYATATKMAMKEDDSSSDKSKATKPKTGISLTGKVGKDGKVKVTKSKYSKVSTKTGTKKPIELNVKM